MRTNTGGIWAKSQLAKSEQSPGSEPETEESYRKTVWQNLLKMAAKANDYPTRIFTWQSDDGGRDVQTMVELMQSWMETDPYNASQLQFSISDDEMNFYLAMVS